MICVQPSDEFFRDVSKCMGFSFRWRDETLVAGNRRCLSKKEKKLKFQVLDDLICG